MTSSRILGTDGNQRSLKLFLELSTII